MTTGTLIEQAVTDKPETEEMCGVADDILTCEDMHHQESIHQPSVNCPQLKEEQQGDNQITVSYLKRNISLQPCVKVRGRPKYTSKFWPSKKRKKCDTMKENNPLASKQEAAVQESGKYILCTCACVCVEFLYCI